MMEGQDELTPREREVLELLKKRWTNEEIAAQFLVDVRTIETQVSHVLHKLGYRDRREFWRGEGGRA